MLIHFNYDMKNKLHSCVFDHNNLINIINNK